MSCPLLRSYTLHKHGSAAALYTKNGHDCSSRVFWMTDTLACLKAVRSLVIAGELVACNDAGLASACGPSTSCTTPVATCANCL
jgi:hypothetical protein